MTYLRPLDELPTGRFETPAILKKLTSVSRKLAELKGVSQAIPNQGILINTLGLQEAKDSSEIENIVTTHDEIFKEGAGVIRSNPAAKEVQHYRDALYIGFQAIKENGLLTINHILNIQAELERNNAGFRKLPGTELKNNAGQTIYTPPQDIETITLLMDNLEKFINEDNYDVDPLIKMALIHHQFESIHPFYDGNGRTGRIINVLYLVKAGLLNIPVLYLSSYIVRTKADYYRLLQAVRDEDVWEEWVLYMLDAVEKTAGETIIVINKIQAGLLHTKHQIRNRHRFYSQDLINNLFGHPYTKTEFIMDDLNVSRLTATKYLQALTEDGLLKKQKIGRSNYYINRILYPILTGHDL